MTVKRLLPLAGLCLLLASCSSKPKDAIVGKWQGDKEGLSVSLEFTRDGTVRMGVEGMETGGKYRFLDDNTIEVERSMRGETQKHKFSVSLTKDELTTTDEKGRVEKLKRVK